MNSHTLCAKVGPLTLFIFGQLLGKSKIQLTESVDGVDVSRRAGPAEVCQNGVGVDPDDLVPRGLDLTQVGRGGSAGVSVGSPN